MALRAVLGLNILDLLAERVEQGLGNRVTGSRSVKLENADVAGRSGGDVCDADQGLIGSRVEARRLAHEDDKVAAQGSGGESGRHLGSWYAMGTSELEVLIFATGEIECGAVEMV